MNGLVLEGGGMRGLYTVGVLEFLLDNQLVFPYVIGVSAGACNALSYLSGQHGRNLRINTDYVDDKRYMGCHSFLKTRSFFGMDMIFDEIPNRLDPFDYDALQACSSRLVIGVTDCETGKPRYYEKEEAFSRGSAQIVRASSSIPVFSPIVEYEGRKLLDGGASDPIPVRKALQDGCDKVVIVLTRNRDYIKEPQSFRAVYHHVFRKLPEMAACLDRRHTVYNDTINYIRELEKEGRALVIAPEQPLHIGRFERNREKLNALYEEGYREAQRMKEQIFTFLGE